MERQPGMISGGNSSMRVRQVSFQIIEADLAESSRRAYAYFGNKPVYKIGFRLTR